VRDVLVTALAACADNRQRRPSLRFLQGLSADELQYIAEFLGSCILESSGGSPVTRAELADQVSYFAQSCRPRRAASRDRDHKAILLVEFLCQSGLRFATMRARTARPA
jgi:hypothetical protein